MQILEILLRSMGFVLSILLVVIGYIVAPLLFSYLDQVQAGNLVGRLLSHLNTGLLIALSVLLIVALVRSSTFIYSWLLIMSIVMVLALEHIISPAMNSIKLVNLNGLTKTSPDWSTFAMWHGMYQLLFLTLIIALFVWSLMNLNYMILNKKKVDKKSL